RKTRLRENHPLWMKDIMKNNWIRNVERMVAVGMLAGLAHSGHAQNLAGDMALSLILVEGKGWELMSEGHQFTDAACADAAGNFYFTDVGKGTVIHQISPDGKVSAFL